MLLNMSYIKSDIDRILMTGHAVKSLSVKDTNERIQTKCQINPEIIAISTVLMIPMIFIMTIMIRLLRMYYNLILIFIKKN